MLESKVAESFHPKRIQAVTVNRRKPCSSVILKHKGGVDEATRSRLTALGGFILTEHICRGELPGCHASPLGDHLTLQAHAVCTSGVPHTFLDMTAGREAGQIISIINSKSDIWAGQWNSPGICFVYFSSAFGTFALYRRRPECVANTPLGVSTKRNSPLF